MSDPVDAESIVKAAQAWAEIPADTRAELVQMLRREAVIAHGSPRWQTEQPWARANEIAIRLLEAAAEAPQAPEPGAWREVAVIPTRNDRTHEQAALDAYRRAVADLGGTLAEEHGGTDTRAVRWAQALDPVTGARLGEVEIVADMQRSALVVRVRRCGVER